MSTRIYNAYKVRDRDRVFQVLEDIRERGEREVIRRLDKYYRCFVDNIDPEDRRYKVERAKDQAQDRPEYSTRLNLAQTALRDGFRKSATSLERDFFDPDVSVALTWHSTGYYLRAFCDRVSLLGGSLDFLERHPDLEDFHYQNQTDPPEHIPEAEFRLRGQIWDEMSVPPGSGQLKNQVVLEISSWGIFWRLDPWLEIYQEYHRRPPKFPIREELLARRLRRLDSIENVVAKPGSISGKSKAGHSLSITKRRKIWVSQVGERLERHVSVDNAVNWLEYLHLPDHLRRQIDRTSPGVIENNILRKRRKDPP